jgi:DNA repair exonuclease SbcCD ATPase subunit
MNITGFKSFKNEAEIYFPTEPGLYFLTGENQVEPGLGANGAGKSSLWEAFIWLISNASSKGRKASDLKAWDAKGIEVTALLEMGGPDPVALTRSHNPIRLEIDRKKASQEDVDKLLGLSRERILHSVIFSQGRRLFYDLDNAGRGALLDEIMDLGLWLELSDDAKAGAAAINNDLISMDRNMSYAQGRLDALPDLEALRAQFDSYNTQTATQVDELIAAAELIQDQLRLEGEVLREAELHQGVIVHDLRPTLQRGINEVQTAIALHKNNRSKLTERKQKISSLMVCPDCLQTVHPQHKAKQLAEINASLEQIEGDINQLEIEAESYRAAFVANEADVLREQQENVARARRTFELKTTISSKDAELGRMLAQIDAFTQTRVNPYEKQLRDAEAEHASLTREITRTNDQILAAKGQLDLYKFWQDGFKRLRLWQIRRVLKVLELEVAGAAASLGLTGWKLAFSTEIENKSGGLKSGIHMQVSSPHSPGVWSDQSGGEEQRVRIGSAIGFAQMIQRMSGVYYGFEVWDEPSNWLSQEGIEALLDFLRSRAMQTKKVIWVVDHRALGSVGFTQVWVAVKTAAGTQIVQVTGEAA